METPMCHMCGEFEVGMFAGGTLACCSAECADQFNTEYDMDAAAEDLELDEYDDSTDDGEALASAGFGTDEDYGGYCDQNDWGDGW